MTIAGGQRDPNNGRMNNPPDSISHAAMDFTPPETWLHLCALRIQARGPQIDDKHARELAADLRRAWPMLTPEDAVTAFFSPDAE